jgi:GTPase
VRPLVDRRRDPVAAPRLAIVGRPNVGKSSLMNTLIGSDRVIVSEEPGTTRDAIDTLVAVEGEPVVLVDTAGLRRRGKVAGTVGYYAQLRAERALARADVALLVCDAQDGITSEDLRVGQEAMQADCATLVALNKWDVSRTEVDHARARLHAKLRLRPQVFTVSALTGRNVGRLVPEALRLYRRSAERIPTPELNRAIGEIAALRQPPSRGGRRLRMFYAAQVSTLPCRIVLKVNDPDLLVRDYGFFVENQLRERFGLEGIPVVLDFEARSRRSR